MTSKRNTNRQKDISRVLRDKARLRREQLKASKPKPDRRAVHSKPSAMILLCGLLAAGPAAADILEIEGEGFVSGEVLSEDEATVQFTDLHGRVRTLPKREVLRIEREKKISAAERTMANFKESVKRTFSKFRRAVDKGTAKVTHPSTSKQAAVERTPSGQELMAAANDRSRPLEERKQSMKLALRKLREEGKI